MTILLFGITKDIVGSSSLKLDTFNELESKIHTVGELKNYLGERYPKLNTLSSLAVAVNNAFAENETVVNTHDEIALIPPVSGG
ncbi:MoaD/ThiS family protein [Sediminicola arcticus]|jgi:molybdopterin synthase sulfur carrier subunit|uniref:Molybdopterin synthase sulfur carrier subunit n=1 Tax=Sediminicola arcticus TaxID=1574308 RepID=A0ABV2STT6_9FLAO